MNKHIRAIKAAWKIRKHIADAVLQKRMCYACWKRTMIPVTIDHVLQYRRMECACGRVVTAPFGWEYVGRLMARQLETYENTGVRE